MTTFTILVDFETGETREVGGTLVACQTPLCENRDVDIEVPDDPNGIAFCGCCGALLRRGPGFPEPVQPGA
jgi:hypothetical protein